MHGKRISVAVDAVIHQRPRVIADRGFVLIQSGRMRAKKHNSDNYRRQNNKYKQRLVSVAEINKARKNMHGCHITRQLTIIQFVNYIT